MLRCVVVKHDPSRLFNKTTRGTLVSTPALVNNRVDFDLLDSSLVGT